MTAEPSPDARARRRDTPTMLVMALCLMTFSACAADENTATNLDDGIVVETGRMHNAAIHEASGLALSHRKNGRLWTMNDGQSGPVLYALSDDGTEHGSVLLTNAQNVDWEDLASFELDGTPWLLVADVGDNLASRDHVSIIIVEEPDLSRPNVLSSRQIDFRYPDGPRDVEAVAVDAREQLVYLLSKRTVPAQLYSVPLFATASNSEEVLSASYLGTVASLPRPTQDDLDRALADMNWYWQPTAMDFSADGKRAIILTYPAVFIYDRQDDESWLQALQRTPTRIELGGIREAEAAALNLNNIFLTVEARLAPIYRIRIPQ
ncbi:MAG: hypothetical protein GXP15_10500 [Gammaproteobacteria bacterium]|nr:hypothetical protein [Gammaproteobacteria bacterium]